MTTTFSPAIDASASRDVGCAQRRSKVAIIAALAGAALLLAGCGVAMRLGYSQGSSLAFRWLDGWVDFNGTQSLRVRAGLDDFFAWHRRTQLTDYADLLAGARVETLADTTPERLCEWATDVRARIDTAVTRAMPTIADVVVTMTPQQVANVERKYAERNGEWRDDHLQASRAKRRDAAIEREVDRAEGFYGTLDAAQRALIARGVDESPFVAEAAYAERLRRQEDAITTLRRLSATSPSPPRAQVEAELAAYLARIDRSPRDQYRAYSKRLVAANCAAAARLHNATTPEQRRHAVRKLEGYEADLRSMAGDAAG